jgi:hypothetical protein
VATELPAGIGCAIIEPQLLDDLATLWFGPLLPERLERIERALRAILTGTTLVAARVSDLGEEVTVEEAAAGSILKFDLPFGDDTLDCEFLPPESAQALEVVDADEGSYLDAFVGGEVRRGANDALPKSIRWGVEADAYAYLQGWYEGNSQADCEERARRRMEDDDVLVAPLEPGEAAAFISVEAQNHARYLVGCHRAGAVVYGDSAAAKACSEHLFSRWPEELFRRFGDEYERAAREVRGPGICVDVPPLMSLVMSRARRRHMIPEVIRDLRAQYSRARANLWDLLKTMWAAPTVAEQVKTLRRLEQAAQSMFAATFPERFDVLSLGLGFAPLGTGAVAGAAKQLLETRRASIRVSSVSLAQRAVRDFRKDLQNSRAVLARHLTATELRDFGM